MITNGEIKGTEERSPSAERQREERERGRVSIGLYLGKRKTSEQVGENSNSNFGGFLRIGAWLPE